ncbi:MAG: DUF4339 domain-containing protein [Planctomycetota bacterium]
MCNQPLHVKDFQAGKRGKCPKCQGSFRVPAKDSDFSLAVEESAAIPVIGKSTVQSKLKSKASSVLDAKMPEKKPLAKSVSPPRPDPRSVSTESASVQSTSQIKPKDTLTQKPAEKPTEKPLEADALTMPASLLPLLDVRWFVRPPSGGQYGPATTQMLLDWIGQKRVTADSLLWREGLTTWVSARELVPEPFGGQSSSGNAVSHDIRPPVPAPPTIAPSSTTSVASTNPITTLEGAASNKAAIAMKKKKQLKQQWIVLGFLVTIAICLVIALFVILTRGV